MYYGLSVKCPKQAHVLGYQLPADRPLRATDPTDSQNAAPLGNDAKQEVV